MEIDLDDLGKIKLSLTVIARDMDETRKVVDQLKVSDAIQNDAIVKVDKRLEKLDDHLRDLRDNVAKLDGRTERGDIIMNNENKAENQNSINIGDQEDNTGRREEKSTSGNKGYVAGYIAGAVFVVGIVIWLVSLAIDKGYIMIPQSDPPAVVSPEKGSGSLEKPVQ